VFLDADNDGRQDILVINRAAPARLLMNRTEGGHWLLLDVRNAAGGPAIGAQVDVTAGGAVRRYIVRTDGSYLAAHDPRVHVGLGEVDAVEQVRVRWPNGAEVLLDDVAVDGITRISPPIR